MQSVTKYYIFLNLSITFILVFSMGAEFLPSSHNETFPKKLKPHCFCFEVANMHSYKMYEKSVTELIPFDFLNFGL